MTQQELKGVKQGDKLLVSYKGMREFTLKNFVCKGGKITLAFGYFDSGDGEGVRLHRVLASTLKPASPAPKTTQMTEEQFLSLANLLAENADRLGYEIIMK